MIIMKVVKNINGRKQETFKGSLLNCKSFLSGIVEQLSDGKLNSWISLEYTDMQVCYTYDDKVITWEITK